MSSRASLASDFGKHLKTTIIHLIKNDGLRPCPEESIETAKLLEAFKWNELSEDEQRARVDKVYAQFGPGSPVEKHFAAYPHHFSQEKYREFRAAMDAYRDVLK
ncbi:MAG: hypothetical protein ILO10_04690 [Kiritimatiellae bacterium]|nr:hypothetical protein [Kiritimatiellia bacterium]